MGRFCLLLVFLFFIFYFMLAVVGNVVEIFNHPEELQSLQDDTEARVNGFYDDKALDDLYSQLEDYDKPQYNIDKPDFKKHLLDALHRIRYKDDVSEETIDTNNDNDNNANYKNPRQSSLLNDKNNNDNNSNKNDNTNNNNNNDNTKSNDNENYKTDENSNNKDNDNDKSNNMHNAHYYNKKEGNTFSSSRDHKNNVLDKDNTMTLVENLDNENTNDKTKNNVYDEESNINSVPVLHASLKKTGKHYYKHQYDRGKFNKRNIDDKVSLVINNYVNDATARKKRCEKRLLNDEVLTRKHKIHADNGNKVCRNSNLNKHRCFRRKRQRKQQQDIVNKSNSNNLSNDISLYSLQNSNEKLHKFLTNNLNSANVFANSNQVYNNIVKHSVTLPSKYGNMTKNTSSVSSTTVSARKLTIVKSKAMQEVHTTPALNATAAHSTMHMNSEKVPPNPSAGTTGTPKIKAEGEPYPSVSDEVRIAQSLNEFVAHLLVDVSKSGNMRKELGLCKTFDRKYQTAQKKVVSDVIMNDMMHCISKILVGTVSQQSCGDMPAELLQFINWLLLNGVSARDEFKQFMSSSSREEKNMFLFSNKMNQTRVCCVNPSIFHPGPGPSNEAGGATTVASPDARAPHPAHPAHPRFQLPYQSVSNKSVGKSFFQNTFYDFINLPEDNPNNNYFGSVLNSNQISNNNNNNKAIYTYGSNYIPDRNIRTYYNFPSYHPNSPYKGSYYVRDNDQNIDGWSPNRFSDETNDLEDNERFDLDGDLISPEDKIDMSRYYYDKPLINHKLKRSSNNIYRFENPIIFDRTLDE